MTEERSRCVALAQNADDSPNNEDSAIVVGSRVSENSIRRSGRLLSGIGNTEGLASLPRHISPEDFRLWEAAYLVEVDLSPHELTTVLKVADALGDRDRAKWVQKLARKAAATEWANSQQADDMLCSLVHLPAHLLSDILSHCLMFKSLTLLLTSFPYPLHPTLTAAAAAFGEIEFGPTAAPIALTHLPHASVPPPGLQHVQIFDHQGIIPADQRMPAATGALLARALSPHTSLTRLTLPHYPLPQRWLRSFAACLSPGALPSLEVLFLASAADGGGCGAAATCISALPALTSLSIGFQLSPQPPPAAASSLSQYTQFTAAAASLPNLKSLNVSEGDLVASHQSHGNFEPTIVSRRSCIPTILPLVSAPSLNCIEWNIQAAVSFLPAALAPLASYTALTRLDLVVNLQPAIAIQALEEAIRQRSPSDGLPVLSASCCSSSSSCVVSTIATAGLLAALARPSLTSITLYPNGVDEHDIENPYDVECTAERIRRAWTIFLPLLGRCTSLTNLSLQCIFGVSVEFWDPYSRQFAAAISGLTQLTSIELRLQDEADSHHDMILTGEFVGEAIAQLVALERFEVYAVRKGYAFDEVQSVLDACARLERLTHLDLSCAGLSLPQLDGFLASQRALVNFMLSADLIEPDHADDAGLRALQARYPAVQLTF